MSKKSIKLTINQVACGQHERVALDGGVVYLVVVAAANGSENRVFESRQDVRF
jgi:hypothetical protein